MLPMPAAIIYFFSLKSCLSDCLAVRLPSHTPKAKQNKLEVLATLRVFVRVEAKQQKI